MGCCSSHLSGQGDLDIEGLAVSQGKEVDGREGVDWGLASDLGSSLVVELGGVGSRRVDGVGSGGPVHADLIVFGAGRRDWDGMFGLNVDVNGG